MFTSILQLPFQPRKQFAFLTNHYSLSLIAFIILGINLLQAFINVYISPDTNQSPLLSNTFWFLIFTILIFVCAVFITPLILKGASSINDHPISYQKAFWVNVSTIIPSLFLLPITLIGLFLFLMQGTASALFSLVYGILEWLLIIWAFIVTVGTIQIAANTSRAKSLTIAFTYWCFTIIVGVVVLLLLGGFFVAF